MDGRLALFPLPVLLPEAHVPLHVFGARYRRTVARCLEFDRRFGVVYHDPDRMGPFLVEPGRAGCMALRPLPEGGRSLLTAWMARVAFLTGSVPRAPEPAAAVFGRTGKAGG